MADTLQKVHKVQLAMALEVKRICEKHNIDYFIIAGTLLGAVRHHGFIPWDDDLDIGMLRVDFEKFVDISGTELRQDYFLQTWDTDNAFGLPIAKIRKMGTTYIERNASKSKMNCGIYIDIFPFDNVPEKKMSKELQNLKTYLLKRIILIKTGYELWEDNQLTKKIIYKALHVVTKPVSLKKLKQMLNKVMIGTSESKSESIVTFGGSYGYRRESIKRSWVENLSIIRFENYELSCPKFYIDYLEYFYGDYLTPPPEEKRYNRHRVIEISFGDENND